MANCHLLLELKMKYALQTSHKRLLCWSRDKTLLRSSGFIVNHFIPCCIPLQQQI